jgi:hypothetical protein
MTKGNDKKPTATAPTTGKHTDLYKLFRSVDASALDKDKELPNDLQKAVAASGKTLSPSHFTKVISVTAKVAKNCSESDFSKFVETGALPPIKLSAEEMELVKGGIVLSGIIGIVGVGAGLIMGATYYYCGESKEDSRDKIQDARRPGW